MFGIFHAPGGGWRGQRWVPPRRKVRPRAWHGDISATYILSLVEVTQPALQGLQSQPGTAYGTVQPGWMFPGQAGNDTDPFHQYHLERF